MSAPWRAASPSPRQKLGIEARINPLGKNGRGSNHDSPFDYRRIRRKENEREGQKKSGCREPQTQKQKAPKLLDVVVILRNLPKKNRIQTKIGQKIEQGGGGRKQHVLPELGNTQGTGNQGDCDHGRNNAASFSDQL